MNLNRPNKYSFQNSKQEGIIYCFFFNKTKQGGGGVKMAEEQDGEITFSSTNSLKEQQNGEQSLQNNF